MKPPLAFADNTLRSCLLAFTDYALRNSRYPLGILVLLVFEDHWHFALLDLHFENCWNQPRLSVRRSLNQLSFGPPSLQIKHTSFFHNFTTGTRILYLFLFIACMHEQIDYLFVQASIQIISLHSYLLHGSVFTLKKKKKKKKKKKLKNPNTCSPSKDCSGAISEQDSA